MPYVDIIVLHNTSPDVCCNDYQVLS